MLNFLDKLLNVLAAISVLYIIVYAIRNPKEFAAYIVICFLISGFFSIIWVGWTGEGSFNLASWTCAAFGVLVLDSLRNLFAGKNLCGTGRNQQQSVEFDFSK